MKYQTLKQGHSKNSIVKSLGMPQLNKKCPEVPWMFLKQVLPAVTVR